MSTPTLLLQLQPWVSRSCTISTITWGRKKKVITNKSLIAADHVQRFFLIAFLFESGPISISLPALHNINISSSLILAGNYYRIQNLIIKIVLGQLFLAFKRASHFASPFPRTRTRPLDKKLCFQRAAYPKKCAEPLEVDEKSAQSNLGKLLQQPPHNWAITKWMYNLSLLNA